MLRALTFILLGAASFAAAYVALDPAPQAPAPAEHVATAVAEAAPAEPRNEPAPRIVRDVTTAEITAGPVIDGPLIRVEAEPQPGAPAPAAEARTQRIFNPIIESAGLIIAGDRRIRLAGIEAPEAEETCGESAWPCGRMARAALRRFIRGRALECEVPAGAAAIPDPAACSIAGESLSRWLVTQGWAESTGEDLAGLEIGARDDGLGIWAAARPDAQEELMVGVPESAPDSALAINARVSSTP